MVRDHFMDVRHVSSEMTFAGWRCVNCGDITDPVIARHHQSTASVPATSKRRWWGPRSASRFLNKRHEQAEGLRVTR